MIRVKRVYDPPSPEDGTRILVDRLWPRGIAKAAATWDQWMKGLAPSDSLRRWFGHDPRKWRSFLKRYPEELGEAIRDALVKAALDAHDDAGVRSPGAGRRGSLGDGGRCPQAR